ncbi:hypothetical protein SCLCIDRAFT_105827 [Scleroderma citrinum Foug A]|uniref:Uncharacterized protein n=1 Tax=Scleroderma citrinum Foug A TaxID=1036808 RepID=A0A0C3A3V2_9AGAM|nr:hypothetical protein SCLCIDRAFT_105827 [Scleroderma citrinum Foug A]
MSIQISAGLIYDLVTQQCAIAVFKNLLPEPHNGCILNLLFDLAAWHAYGKLQCHAPNTFGTVNMECTVNSRLSWSEQ